MDLSSFTDKWKSFVGRMNQYGIPIPTLRDPKLGLGSVSLTLLCISSLLVVVGIVGKWSKMMGEIDIGNALEFFGMCYAGYFGRQWQTKGGAKIGDNVTPPNPPTP